MKISRIVKLGYMVNSIKIAMSVVHTRPQSYNHNTCHVFRDHSTSKINCMLNRADAIRHEIKSHGLTQNLRNEGERVLRDADNFYNIDLSYYSSYISKVFRGAGYEVQKLYFQMPEEYERLEQVFQVLQDLLP
jgi:hypothetical protein